LLRDVGGGHNLTAASSLLDGQVKKCNFVKSKRKTIPQHISENHPVMKKLKSEWFLIDTEQEYENALARYQEIKYAPQNSNEHKEKLLLAHLIADYEEKTSELPQVDPIELIKIRMEDSWNGRISK
jgi:hypothetical protein